MSAPGLNHKSYIMIQLNYKKWGEGPAIIVLHGLFGSLDNWATLSRQWADSFTMYLVDLRNHGKSPHTDTHTLSDMVHDLVDFIETHHIDQPVVLGHSMGGKVAMELALEHPDLVGGLIVVDIAPKQYNRGHDYIFNGIHSLDLDRVTSRKEIQEILKQSIPNESEVLFLSKNIDRSKDGFSWKINVDTLEKDYEEVIREIGTGRIYNGNVLVVRGSASSYIKDEDFNQIRALFPHSRLETIPGAGHWVHADNPEAFDICVREFMAQL